MTSNGIKLNVNQTRRQSLQECKKHGQRYIHAVVDALGNPLKIVLSAGQLHDTNVAPQLICDLKSAIVMADASYDSLTFREQRVV